MKHKIKLRTIVALSIICLITVGGVTLLALSHAQTPYVSVSVNSGTLTFPAVTQSNSSGKYVQFGDFITASGTNLMLNGSTWKAIGYDAYGMTGCWNGVSGTPWTDAELDAYFSSLPANGLTRIWADEDYGTSQLVNVVNQATKYNQHLILSIGNDDGACNKTTTDPDQTGEPLFFYEGGWQGQYVSWVNELVPMFADNPTVAMWEIANEPGNSTSVPESTMASYLSGTAAAIKAVDPNQLIESGLSYAGVTNNLNQGTEADYEAVQSSPDINVISFHDYAWDYENKSTLSSNFTEAQTASSALKKPFIAGEVGVEAGPSTCTSFLTQAQRVSYFQTKATDYLSGIGPSGAGSPDASAVMFWDYVPEGPGAICQDYDYNITPSDPVVNMVQNFVIPN